MKYKTINLIYKSLPFNITRYFHLQSHRKGISYWAEKDIVFLHIPKSAGTSVNRFFKSPDIGHFTYSELVQLDSRYAAPNKIFVSIIRDPVERLHSTYHYALSKYRNNGVSTLSWIADYETKDKFILDVYERKIYMKHYFFRPASDFSVVDERFKFLDFSRLNESLLNFNNAYRINVCLDKHNISNSDYSGFSSESISLIHEMYKDDFAIIDKFESSGEALLNGCQIYKR